MPRTGSHRTEADKAEVARALREIAVLLEAEGANPFKVRAYERGARAVESLGENLPELVAGKRLTQVSGIGTALAAVIEELVTTGRSEVLEKLRSSLPPGVAELRSVLTLPRMRALHEALGISTLDQLREAAESGRVRGVKGFGEKTERKILADIAALAAQGDDVLLEEAVAAAEPLLSAVRAQAGVSRCEPSGPFRRRVELMPRIDLLAASETPEDVLDRFVAQPAAVSTLAREGDAASVRLGAGPTARLRVVPAARFEWEWLRETGSEGHLGELRARAARLGLDLADDGLARRGGLRPATEAGLYEALGLPWLTPELREGAGEVEAAAAGALPGELVDLADVQGFVHCHTVYSDGRNTVEEMARAAEQLGMRYITITDHSPTAAYAGGLTLDRLERQWEEIDRVQETVSVRILRGTESDILQDGALDWPDHVLERLDVVVASIHNRHKMDRAQMTGRLLGAMRQPFFKIWGHGLGRLLRRRDPIDCDVEAVLDAAAASRAAIEINGDPHRMDLEPRWVRAARERGLRFVLSTDAHATGQLRHLHWAVAIARRAGVQRGEVLNALDATAFTKAVRPAA